MSDHLNEFTLTTLMEDEGFLDPVRVRRIFLMIVREHFSDTNNYLNEAISDLVYTESNKTRSLDVDLDFVYDVEEIGKKPSIFVGTAPFTFEKQVVGNSLTKMEDNSAVFQTTKCSTSVMVKHMATAADLSLILANQSLNFLGCIREHMMTLIPGILMYEVGQMTPPSLVDSAKIRVFQSNLEIKLVFSTIWSSYIESHRIKNIVFTGNPVIQETE